MTVLEASNKLIEHFSSHDYFEMLEHFKKITLVSETEADKASLLLALEELAKQNIILKKDIKNQEFWVLVRPLTMQNYEISVTLPVAAEIAAIVAKYTDMEGRQPNPFNITERDLAYLVGIIKQTLN
jgi:hypothetical protein